MSSLDIDLQDGHCCDLVPLGQGVLDWMVPLSLGLLDCVDVPLHLLVHLPADNGVTLPPKDPGEHLIWENDPAIHRVLEVVPLDVGPDILADVSPGEAAGSNNGLQRGVHFHQPGSEGESSCFLHLPGPAHLWIPR